MPSDDDNVVGDGGASIIPLGNVTALTDLFDQNSDFVTATFTAPVTGRYKFVVTSRATGVDMTEASWEYISSNRFYVWVQNLNNFISLNLSFPIFTDMDAADTIYIRNFITDASGKVDDWIGNASSTVYTAFSGYLIC